MGLAASRLAMTAEDYLAWEATQSERHDFVLGEVFAMPGAEERHVTAAGKAYFYPDVVVTCSEADRASPMIKREPLFIAEVLSPGTAAHDRGEKFAHYRQIPSLHEVAFIDVDSRRTDVYRKGGDGLWVLHDWGNHRARLSIDDHPIQT